MQKHSSKNSTYPLSNRWAYAALSTLDFLLKGIPLRRNFKIPSPKKIVLINLGHLGDVILTTTLLKPLKKAFPSAEIGMVVGSWSHPILKGHPLLSSIHHLDHWKVNRGLNHRYKKMRKTLLQEIQKYDVAIDCSFHFPNASPLLWRANIPTRIGFTSAGFGPLLTHSLPWRDQSCSAPLSFFSLLQFLGIEGKPSKPFLPPVESKDQNYIVMHMGAGDQRKEWDRAQWRALANTIDRRIFFTGRGEREKEMIDWVIQEVPHAKNLCDKLSWSEFVGCIQGADCLITVDTSAGHVAAAVDTPVAVIFTSVTSPEIWKPFGENVYTFSRDKPEIISCITNTIKNFSPVVDMENRSGC
ncbi:MAG: hypothetical protein S4CHLAM45_01590 [Chlamydiales bacterium]|nr:hypothetical protein [Chlamydiales bacterium]MCH9619478.1 hypothetical protein [Chlamydiales bacterium]MCH9622282.1 hypothetical protein [Chlamydiales bacterium]